MLIYVEGNSIAMVLLCFKQLFNTLCDMIQLEFHIKIGKYFPQTLCYDYPLAELRKQLSSFYQ